MSLTKYQIFIKTVECGSFTKAAKLLGFTQSGVSHAIGALEAELGLVLLSRDRGGLSLTADGRAMLPYFQEICAMQHQLEEAAKDLKGMETGLVRVGTFTSVSVQWIPYILKSFRDKYNNIEFEILPGDYKQVERWVEDGVADCGFLRLPGQRRLDYVPLHRDQLLVITAPDYPLEEGRPFPSAELARLPFIQQDEGEDSEVGAALDELQVEPRIHYTVKEDQTILAMVSNDLGISIMPELMVKRSPFPLRQYPLEKPFYRNIGLAVKDRESCSVSTRRFLEHVEAWVKENGR